MPPSQEQIFAAMKAANPNKSASPVSIDRTQAPMSSSLVATLSPGRVVTKICTLTPEKSNSYKLSPLAPDFLPSSRNQKDVAAILITQPASTNDNIVFAKSASPQLSTWSQRSTPKTFMPPTRNQLTTAFKADAMPTTQPAAQSFTSTERLTVRPDTTDIVARRMIGHSLGVHVPQKTDKKTLEIAAALKKEDLNAGFVDHVAEQKKRMDEFYAMMKGGKK